LDHVRIKEVLKAALPDKSRLIETSPPAAFHDLLDALEEKLLAELKNMLEGRDLDEAAIVQAKHIVDASNKLASQDTEVAAAINKKRPQETLCK
jgi:predicted house-cleaning noncanonical NTP pyrophosphatase (MazG superfamily)